MFYNYIYKNKKTGEKVYSRTELKDENLETIFQVKQSVIKSGNDEVVKKTTRKTRKAK